MNDQRITVKYACIGMGVVLLSWFVHEFAHWLASESFGYDTIMRLNSTYPAGDILPTDRQQMVISAAGPLVTLVQGLAAFLFLRRRWSKTIYLFLFAAFYMRLLAGLLNFINPNDEGRISIALGLGMPTLPILMVAVLFYLVQATSKAHRLTWRFQLWTTLITLVASSALILSDQFFGIRVV